MDPVYTSTSKITSSGSGGSNFSVASGIAAQFGIQIPSGAPQQKWVYPEIIKSSTIIKRLLAMKFNTEKYGQDKLLLEILGGESNSENNKYRLEYSASQSMKDMIEINEDIQTGIMTIIVNSPDPSLSYQLNKALIEELDHHQKNYNNLLTNKARSFIGERVKQTEKELNLAEESLKNFRDRNRRIENSPGLLLDQQRLNREVLVLTGVFTTLKQQLETTKIEQVKDSDYIIIIDPPTLPIFYTFPRKRQYVLLAGLFGIGFGLVLAFLKHYTDLLLKKEKDNIISIISILFNNIKSIIPFQTKNKR